LDLSRKHLLIISIASSPEILTTASPEIPGGVAIAAIVLNLCFFDNKKNILITFRKC
jgi:hypothetical protein